MTKEERLEQYKKDIIQFKETKMNKLKPNPNNYPIINKWNIRYVIRPNEHELFKMIENAVDDIISISLEEVRYGNIR